MKPQNAKTKVKERSLQKERAERYEAAKDQT